MKFFIGLMLWCLLFVICWPLAILMLILYPVIWLLLLPFRLLGLTVTLTISMIAAVFMLPFKLVKAI